MRVIGGKEIPGTGGQLGAYVTRIYPGGVVESLGEIKEGTDYKLVMRFICYVPRPMEVNIDRYNDQESISSDLFLISMNMHSFIML
jgi:hypothetical protein